MGKATRVPFLLSYTLAEPGDPKDFAYALETLNGNNDTSFVNEAFDVNETFLQAFPIFVPFFSTEMLQYNALPEVEAPGQHASDEYSAIFQARAAELVQLLENAGRATNCSSSTTVGSLLTAGNLALCVDTFFRNAHKHLPIIHEPSFTPEDAETSLLLAIFVVGAVWSYPRDTYFMVLDIIEMIEKCIFEGQIFQELREVRQNDRTTSPHIIALLQAATLLVSISFAFPNPDHRRRFRDHRFLDLIAAIRLLPCEDAKDDLTPASDPESFEWSTFITRECCNR